jgi:hypothetical protein
MPEDTSANSNTIRDGTERDFGAEEVQLVLIGKKSLRAEGKREPAVPARESRSEERPRKRKP